MSASPRFRVLGPVTAWRDDRELELGPPQQRLVLAALLLARGRAMSTDQLIEAVWGDQSPRTALTVLRTYVSRLRAVLGESAVVGAHGGYAVPDGELDVEDAEELVGRAQRTDDVHKRYSLLSRAVELWTDEPLAGLSGGFVRARRELLRERRLAIMERLLTVRLELGDNGGTITQLTPLCGEHPFRERLRGLLMLALYRAGRRGEALATYADLRRRLAEQLGIDPGQEITGLHRRIVSDDPALTLSATEAAPAFSLPRPAQLPADIGDFTGRAAVIEALTQALADGTDRVVAVSGIGGVGKTTLALRVAHLVREHFPDGQLYADLRGVEPEPHSAATVLSRFLRALGVDPSSTPDDVDERAGLFRSLLADKRMLVLLDNAADTEQVRWLLPGAPRCAVLVTSRSKLTELSGAHRVDLDVLEPDEAMRLFRGVVGEERVRGEPAAALDVVSACGFLPLAVRIAAARLSSRARWTIANLAERLSEQRRLRELRTGDQTVAAAFALSYRQLDAEHARAFRLLAVPDLVRLGLDEAAAVLGVDRRRAAELVATLVELSLVESPSPQHYRLHDLVRLYGSQQTTAEEYRDALRRLTGHYLEAAGEATASLSPELPTRLRFPHRHPGSPLRQRPKGFRDAEAAARWLDAEAGSIVATLSQSLRDGIDDLACAAELLYAICDWSQAVGNRRLYIDLARGIADAATAAGDAYAEARSRLCLTDTLVLWHPRDAFAEAHRIRDLATELDDDVIHAEATMLLADAMANAKTGGPEEQMSYRDEAAARLDGRPGSRDLVARVNCVRAVALAQSGRVEEALDISSRAVARLRTLGGTAVLARTLLLHSHVAFPARGASAAAAAITEALELARTTRDYPLEMLARWRLAVTRLESGAFAEAVVEAEHTIVAADRVGDDYKHAQALVILGQALWGLGQAERARACLAEAVPVLSRHYEPEAEQTRKLLNGYGVGERRHPHD